MRRDVSLLRGEARPRKRFCPPRTHSPHLNLSQPPFEAWCADPVHPHFYSGWQLGGRVRLSPFAARPFAAGEPHVKRHSCFSPAVYGTRAGHPSAQHFSLHHPEQGRRGLSFTVEGAAASRPSRHPISGMSSLTRHPDSSVALPSRMGASTLGIAVGSPHNSNRLHSSVWKKSPPFRRGSPDSSKQRRQGFCSTTGTFLSPAERSNRRSTAVGSRTRFLQPLLPRSKEGRRLEAYSGSTAFEFFPLQREVQDADDENHHVSGPGGRLVCHHRPEGCVFSHPGRSKTQEIPSVRLWREGLPIQGPALRPGFGSEDIYQMHGCCTGPFEAPGHSCTELSGRLAHSGSLQGASESSQGYRSRPHPFSWPLQERLTAGAAATTLRVYVAAIAARRELDEIPLGRHRMVSAFMRGARRLRPVRPTAVPSWDLSVVLEGLVTAPFEPLESASDRILTLKVVLLLALTSLKRVGDLQAFSVSETCMDFAPGLVKVTLRPRPGYIPEVLSTLFRSQVVTLHSFHPPPFASSEDERLHMLCPVRALKLYVDRSKVWRKSPQLLICFGAGRRGLATSKQRISHWVRDAISLAYEARKLPSPLSLRAHSTRGVASSQALFRGVPLEDICVAAGWSSPHTFRFYNLDVDTAPGFQVLSVWTDRMLLVHYWAR